MKYIDADKLKKVIEDKGLDCSFALKMERLDTLALIDELQQEQPEGLHFTPLNRLIQKIPSKNWNDTVNNYAKKLRDCLIKEEYLKDAEVLQDYISYMNGNNVPMATMDEQEQPEVDLEKEIEQYTIGFIGELKCYKDWTPRIARFARHFYGLRNRALEEAARHVYESWMGGAMDDVRLDMAELGKVLNARKE